MQDDWDGGCLCGVVRLRAPGAPGSVFVAFGEADVEVVQGAITRFRSSAGTVRGFCATCGSTLTGQGDARPDELHIHVGAFASAADLPPAFHIFPEERLPWLCLAEQTEAA